MKNTTSVERASDLELVVSRQFNGPARLLFDAWTKPELLKLWWAPKSRGVSLFECESDLRVGGLYRFAFGRSPVNPEVFSGRFLEIARPNRLAFTQVYERIRSAGEGLVTATFAENAGVTRLTLRQQFPTKDALDTALASGMADGMRETFDQLDGLVGETMRQ